MNQVFKIDGCQLLTHERIDLMFKYLYAKDILNKKNFNFSRAAYYAHLAAWNNFLEFDDLTKNSFDEYERRFAEIIKTVSVDGMDPRKSLISITEDGILLNGSHRVGASIASNFPVWGSVGVQGKDGTKNCGSLKFKSKGLSYKYLDWAVLEFIRLKKNARCFLFFPTTRANYEPALRVLEEAANVVHLKRIVLRGNGPLNLMKELYFSEAWGGESSDWSGFKRKANWCFPAGQLGEVLLVVYEPKESVDIVALKKKIRDIYKVENHSCHSTDTHEETVRVCCSLLNSNSINFLNSSNPIWPERFNKLFKLYQNVIDKNTLPKDNYIISGSAVIAAFGARDCSDIDYVTDEKIFSVPGAISSHNKYIQKYYPHDSSRLLNDPSLIFYIHGYKFFTPNLIAEMKSRRQEEKDARDCELIDNLLKRKVSFISTKNLLSQNQVVDDKLFSVVKNYEEAQSLIISGDTDINKLNLRLFNDHERVVFSDSAIADSDSKSALNNPAYNNVQSISNATLYPVDASGDDVARLAGDFSSPSQSIYDLEKSTLVIKLKTNDVVADDATAAVADIVQGGLSLRQINVSKKDCSVDSLNENLFGLRYLLIICPSDYLYYFNPIISLAIQQWVLPIIPGTNVFVNSLPVGSYKLYDPTDVGSCLKVRNLIRSSKSAENSLDVFPQARNFLINHLSAHNLALNLIRDPYFSINNIL